MKRTVSLLLTLCLLLSCLPAVVSAADGGKCGEKITWSFDSSNGRLSLAGSGEMYESAELWGWEVYAEEITSIKLSSGIKSIGAYAFAYLPNLKSVSLPSSLDYIYPSAFEGCESLSSVTLPEGLLELYEYAFAGCSSLKETTLPKSLEYLGLLSFDGCVSLEKFKVASGNPYLSTDSSGVLFNKDKTVLYMAPGGLTGGYSIPGGVVEVFPYAFMDCISVTGLFIPDSVTKLHENVFTGCLSLENIWVGESNRYYSHDYKGLLYNKNKSTLLQVPGGKTGAVTIPESVRTISPYALYGCVNVTDVALSGKLTTIGEYAFAYCMSLEDIALPDSVITLGEYIFAGDISLKSAKMPRHYFGIPEGTFYGCLSLKDITFSDSKNDIQDYAFFGCASLERVELTSSEYIGEYAFAGCTGLKEFKTTLHDSFFYPVIKKCAFAGCVSLKDIYFGGSCGGIEEDALQDVTAVVHYPSNPYYNWDRIEKRNYGGSITWKPYAHVCDSHLWDEYYYVAIDYKFSCDICGAALDVYVSQTGGEIALALDGSDAVKAITVTVKDSHAGEEVSLKIPRALKTDALPAALPVISVTVPQGSTLILDIPVETLTADTKVYGISDGGTYAELEAVITETGVQVVLAENSKIVVCNGRYHPFTDILKDKFYYEPVLWAVDKGITKGTSATTFSPDNACTRKQIVTFLWRAAGSPEPESMENPFTDVTRGDQFEKAILWAVEQGITKGTSTTTFSPENPCTRKQVVTFLWRAAGSPEPESMDNPFTDVTRGDQFEKAILWAFEQGITTGKTETTFKPEAGCTRGQIVTFLYRSMA